MNIQYDVKQPCENTILATLKITQL